MARTLHPTLKARAAAVKKAHGDLSKADPSFRSLPPSEQFRRTQQHVGTKKTEGQK